MPKYIIGVYFINQTIRSYVITGLDNFISTLCSSYLKALEHTLKAMNK